MEAEEELEAVRDVRHTQEWDRLMRERNDIVDRLSRRMPIQIRRALEHHLDEIDHEIAGL